MPVLPVSGNQTQRLMHARQVGPCYQRVTPPVPPFKTFVLCECPKLHSSTGTLVCVFPLQLFSGGQDNPNLLGLAEEVPDNPYSTEGLSKHVTS